MVFETKKFTLPNISNHNCADRCKGFQYQRIFPDISIHINSKFSLALNHPLFLIINLRKLSNPACLFTLPRTSFIHRKNIWWTKIIYVNIFLDETAGNHAGQNHDEAKEDEDDAKVEGGHHGLGLGWGRPHSDHLLLLHTIRVVTIQNSWLSVVDILNICFSFKMTTLNDNLNCSSARDTLSLGADDGPV